jgi:hypothetical protein
LILPNDNSKKDHGQITVQKAVEEETEREVMTI